MTPAQLRKLDRELTEYLDSMAEVASESPQGSFTLKLWDAEMRRTVTLGNVTFP